MSDAVDNLLERMKAAAAEHPMDTARRRELTRRHDELRQRQFIAAAEKIKTMTPGLYSYFGFPNKTSARIYLLTDTHRLFDLEFSRGNLGRQGIITSGCDPDMLWRLRRIA